MDALRNALVKAGLANPEKAVKIEEAKRQREEKMREEEHDRPKVNDIEDVFDRCPELEPEPDSVQEGDCHGEETD